MAKVRASNVNSALQTMRFGILHETPSDLDLPKVHGEYPSGSAFFLACDANYFNVFGIPLLKSIAAQNLQTPLHLHLMAADSSIVERVLAAKGPMTVTATWENPSPFITERGIPAPDYYGCARLVRFAEALHRTNGALCMLDVDSLANRDPMEILNTPGAIGLRVRPGRIEAFHQFSACMVLGRRDGIAYFDQVANIVKAGMAAPWWGLDQYALFSAWTISQPALSLFGPHHADVSGTDANGVFLFTAGANKKTLMTDQTPYAQLFRKHR